MMWDAMDRLRAITGAVTLLLLAGNSGRAGDVIDFDSDRWAITSGKVEEHLGRTSLAGQAELKDVRFGDGVIECNIAVTGERSFPGIVFRSQDAANSEILYLRPHSPKAPDALQYTPIWNGLTSWQLYSGRGYTAAIDIPYERWIHIRLEVVGTRARVFIDDSEEPVLVVSHLQLGRRQGGLGLRAPAGGSVHFSDFRLGSSEGLDFGPLPKTAPVRDRIVRWQLSQPFPITQVDRARTPEEQALTGIVWQDVEADARGLVDIGRHVTKTGSDPEVVLARAFVDSERGEVKSLRFGYSDAASLFVNGQLLFSGNSAFRSRDPRFPGIIGLNDAVLMRLKPGHNELLLMVAESMGGWGLMCRLEPVHGEAVRLDGALEPAWQIEKQLERPESAVYDSSRGVLYVSNFSYPGSPEEPRGFLSKLSLDGQILALAWASGLNRPTGIALHDGMLFAVERGSVAVIDPETGAVAERHPCPSNGLLNDLAVARDGSLFVSDSVASVIYRVADGACEEWRSGWPLQGPNGLLAEGTTLVVANVGAGNLLFLDQEGGEVEEIIELEPGTLDGLRPDGHGGYLVSQFEGRIFRVQRSGEVDVLFDGREAPRFCADFEYVPEKRLLVVPSLWGNGVFSYVIDLE